MSNKMLIDASHPEETRVVVTRGNRIEEFDFESESKKQLKGNIYLARVTRVEPSLQAAFVEYGGNRHGFLAFSEIHPDYYQIPVADRQAILAEEAEQVDDDDEDSDKAEPAKRKRRRGGRGRGRATTKTKSETPEKAEPETEIASDNTATAEISASEDQSPESENDSAEPAEEQVSEAESNAGQENADPDETVASAPAEIGSDDVADDNSSADKSGGGTMAASVHIDMISEPLPDEEADREAGDEEVMTEPAVAEASTRKASEEKPKKRARRATRAKKAKEPEPSDDNDDSSDDGDQVESVGAEDALEELPSRKRPVRRQYKIQEVIKRRQILLVQVVKEERGNKGAALTTYLSLAGRYSVLMPNTARGGGISRKITNMQDRKRLKDVVQELDVPQGMGVILRTAGANRTKAEIKRDYEYLMRLWMTIRNLTLESTAPSLVHEEGSLIKRSVRDLYNKDIGEILVAGDEGYREAKDFMRMLMPSHAKAVQPYKEVVPIFARNGIEAQLDRMLQPQVTLKSGGYIIINQTEALVAIDVNSGRSTREHSIEDTALQTNLEAADEVARQLRLRDLAGLIVIDFIDMEEKRNNRAVEKRLKECLKHDRARIQVGRISHFGLLEMSRQRIRASVLESTMQLCETCHGTGYVRSESSVALHVVRGIEEYLLKESGHNIVVRTSAATALYVLNNKRANLSELEERFGLSISVEADETLGAQHFQIDRGEASDEPGSVSSDRETAAAVEAIDETADQAQDGSEEGGGKKRRRRRRKKSGKGEDGGAASADSATDTPTAGSDSGADTDAELDDDNDEPKKRRRGRRGGRRNRSNGTAQQAGDTVADTAADQGEISDTETVTDTNLADQTADTEEPAKKPLKSRRRSKKDDAAETAKTDVASPNDATTVEESASGSDASEETGEADTKPVRRTRRKGSSERDTAQPQPAVSIEPVVTSVVSESGEETEPGDQPRRQGWWKRKGFF